MLSGTRGLVSILEAAQPARTAASDAAAVALAPGFFMIRVPISDRRCPAERGLYFSRPVQGPGRTPGRLVREQGARALDKPLRPRSSYLCLASDKRRRRS